MNYTITRDDETEKEVDFSIESSNLERFIDEEVARVQKDLTLNGFRKGKVPQAVIKTRFRDSLKAQALNDLVSDSFVKLLAEKQWHAASQAELVKLDEGTQITFRLRFEIIPEFAVENYLGVEIYKEEPLPEDFLLEQVMNEVRDHYATVKEVTRPIVVDDIVTVDLKIKEQSTIKVNEQDVSLRVGDRNLPDEVNRQLVGARIKDRKDIAVGNEVYSVAVKKIEEKILPHIDDDFAKALKFENVDQLKKKMLDDAKKIEEKRIEDALKESLSSTLVERTKLTVPESLIKNEYQRMLQKANLTDSPSNKERFWNIAEQRVRLNLILQKIAQKENIQVAEDETMKVISAMGLTLTGENRKNVLDYVGDILLREKTIDHLYRHAKISEKSRIITPKEALHDIRSVRH